jgi:TorA maturation chaperone TorD
MTPHVQVRLSTLRKLFAPSLPPCVYTYNDRLDSRPPNGVLTLVNSLATKRHRTLHHADTDEEMVSQIRQFV